VQREAGTGIPKGRFPPDKKERAAKAATRYRKENNKNHIV